MSQTTVPNRCECQTPGVSAKHRRPPPASVPVPPNDAYCPRFRGSGAYRRHCGEWYIVVVPMCLAHPKPKQKKVHTQVPVSPHRCACQTPSATPSQCSSTTQRRILSTFPWVWRLSATLRGVVYRCCTHVSTRPKSKQKKVHTRVPTPPHRCACQTPDVRARQSMCVPETSAGTMWKSNHHHPYKTQMHNGI